MKFPNEDTIKNNKIVWEMLTLLDTLNNKIGNTGISYSYLIKTLSDRESTLWYGDHPEKEINIDALNTHLKTNKLLTSSQEITKDDFNPIIQLFKESVTKLNNEGLLNNNVDDAEGNGSFNDWFQHNYSTNLNIITDNILKNIRKIITEIEKDKYSSIKSYFDDNYTNLSSFLYDLNSFQVAISVDKKINVNNQKTIFSTFNALLLDTNSWVKKSLIIATIGSLLLDSRLQVELNFIKKMYEHNETMESEIKSISNKEITLGIDDKSKIIELGSQLYKDLKADIYRKNMYNFSEEYWTITNEHTKHLKKSLIKNLRDFQYNNLVKISKIQKY